MIGPLNTAFGLFFSISNVGMGFLSKISETSLFCVSLCRKLFSNSSACMFVRGLYPNAGDPSTRVRNSRGLSIFTPIPVYSCGLIIIIFSMYPSFGPVTSTFPLRSLRTVQPTGCLLYRSMILLANISTGSVFTLIYLLMGDLTVSYKFSFSPSHYA